MSRPDKEPIWQTVTKGIAAVVLVLLALAFGAGGACGVWMAGTAAWDTLRWRRNDPYGATAIAAVCAVVGLGLAAVAMWGVVLMFRKKGDRDE
jgi:hypothetical protein